MTSSDTAVDTTDISVIGSSILPAMPTGVKVYYYNPNSGLISPDYVYSWQGKAYLNPLNTRFFFIYSNVTDVTVEVIYANTSLGGVLTKCISASLLLAAVVITYIL